MVERNLYKWSEYENWEEDRDFDVWCPDLKELIIIIFERIWKWNLVPEKSFFFGKFMYLNWKKSYLSKVVRSKIKRSYDIKFEIIQFCKIEKKSLWIVFERNT